MRTSMRTCPSSSDWQGPDMTHAYELAHLSMIAVPPARLAAVAAEAGFDFTGFRLTPSPSSRTTDVIQ